ncbi:hypothetical protein [Chryseobacterium sp. JK1]|uniref:hypothetical protein n=1 Tax=Chryseobacterium sp. JK1 TaxID=874294 RepID=UPI003D69C47D
MKKRVIITGGMIGVLFPLWDLLTDQSDIASLDSQVGAGFIVSGFFSIRTFIYLSMGMFSGWMISLIIGKVCDLHREWNDL